MHLENLQAIGAVETHMLRSVDTQRDRSQQIGVSRANRLWVFQMHACKSLELYLHHDYAPKYRQKPPILEFIVSVNLTLI